MALPEAKQARAESRRAEAKRAQIRAAASGLFRVNGFEQTSMDAITAAARVSKRTLYRYYPSKEALLGEIVHQLTVARDHPQATLQAEPHPRITSLSELEDGLFDLATRISANHRTPEFLGLVRVMIAETPRYPDLARQYNQAVIDPGIAMLRAIFDRARAGGLALTVDSDSAARLFIGGLLFWTFNALLAPGEPAWPTPDQLREHARLVVAAVS